MTLYFQASHEPAWGSTTIAIDVIRDVQLDDPVRWWFLGVFAGPSSCIFDDVPDSVGSDRPFHEALRFSTHALRLAALDFSVPDRALAPDLAEGWLEAPILRGLPRLRVQQNFNLDRVDGHFWSHDGGQLMGLMEGAQMSSDRLRLRVASEFDLLFSSGRYVGWMLGNPIAHVISPERGDPMPTGRVDVDGELIELFGEYFRLIDEPMVERMEDEDPEVQKALVSLLGRIGTDSTGHGPRFALHRRVAGILSAFYGGL